MNDKVEALTRYSMNELLFDPARFAQLREAAIMLYSSPMVPKTIKGDNKEEGISNISLCLALAADMRENFLILAQNVYFVGTTPGWKTQYMIAKVNRQKVFQDEITWSTEIKPNITIRKRERVGWENQKPKYEEKRVSVPNISVTAEVTLKSGKLAKVTCDMALAEAEGWTVMGDKYHTNPEHQLKWRSASALIKLYAPEVMLGYPTVEELETMPQPDPGAPPNRFVASREMKEGSIVTGATEVKGDAKADTSGQSAIEEAKTLIQDGIERKWLQFPEEVRTRLTMLISASDTTGILALVKYLSGIRPPTVDTNPESGPNWLQEEKK